VQQAELEDDHSDRNQDRDRGTQRSSGGGPEDVRIGQWIPKQALEGRTGRGQPDSDYHRRQDAWQTKVPDDRLGRRRPRPGEVEAEQVAGQDRGRVGRGDWHGAETNTDNERDDQRRNAHPGKDDRPPPKRQP
jgi:hypothetical protein